MPSHEYADRPTLYRGTYREQRYRRRNREHGVGPYWTPNKSAAQSYARSHLIGDDREREHRSYVDRRRVDLRGLRAQKVSWPQDIMPIERGYGTSSRDTIRGLKRKYPNAQVAFFNDDRDLEGQRHSSYLPLTKGARRAFRKAAPRRVKRAVRRRRRNAILQQG